MIEKYTVNFYGYGLKKREIFLYQKSGKDCLAQGIGLERR
jgi:hypothetical protein